ncbi:hypothetical protein ACP70R_014757 [Stipagrostis hirtigluma subsp. patula]
MPSSPPPPDGGGGGGGGGEGEEDLISALPDDVLRLVLLRLPSTAAAARTSVLSRRWCRLWAHLPELRFPCGAGSIARARAALADHDASVLRLLFVEASGADPGHATALLLLAAPRLAGHLFFSNEPTESGPGDGGAVELPCFEKVEEIYLQLGNLALTLPVSGVFADLTVLVLTHVRFHGPCDLGDAISSARCPSLRKLVVRGAQGLSNLTIRSESLIIIDLYRLDGLQELTIVAPMLTVLSVSRCFLGRKPLANISAPAMEIVRWRDAYDSNSVHLGELVCLQILSSSGIFVYGPPGYTGNLNSARLLQHFQKIPIQHLVLSIIYPTEMVNCQYLMDAITLLPCIEILELGLATAGHVFGHSVFHLLRISTSLRNLNLVFLGDFEEHKLLAHEAAFVVSHKTGKLRNSS